MKNLIEEGNKSDLFFFHRGGIVTTNLMDFQLSLMRLDTILKNLTCKKAFWFFDKVVGMGENFLESIIPSVDFGFLNDDTWIRRHKYANLYPMHLAFGKIPTGKYRKEYDHDIVFMGSVYPSREPFMDSLKEVFGDGFRVYSDKFGQDFADICKSAKIVVSPGSPFDDFYWSDRVYLTLASGGFLIHPKLEGLKEELGNNVFETYNSWEELVDKIRYWLDPINNSKRQNIVKSGRKLILEKFAYINRVRRNNGNNPMKYRCANGVHVFAPKIELAWNLEKWQGWQDPDKEVLFFGMYEKRDYDVYHNCEGKKTIFWCGSDILMMLGDPEVTRIAKENPETEHWTETNQQAEELARVGIKAKVCPSFLANVNDYPLSFQIPLPNEKWKIWLSGHPNREKEYGFEDAKEIAKMFDNIEIHFYGVDGESTENVIYHGFVPEEQLDKEIRKYHSAMRGNQHDGVSEVVIKSLLLGQYPITKLPYERVWQYNNIGELAKYVVELQTKVTPNYEPRVKWMKAINQFPWCYRNYWKPDERP